MELGGSNSTCMMAFGDNGNGLCPLMTNHHQHQHHHHSRNHPSSTSSALFLPLPEAPPNQHQNRNTSGGSSMILDDHNTNTNTNTCYFMDSSDASTAPLKAKIMAHPHYNRLLTAYISCQKVNHLNISLSTRF